MTMAMVLLVGEQPAPNLLPVRHMKPDAAVLVYTERTEGIAKNLRALLEPEIACLLCPVQPFGITHIRAQLQRFLTTEAGGYKLVFNVTGGTKEMAVAAFLVAQSMGAQIVYLQSEGDRPRLLQYHLDGHELILTSEVEVEDLISLDDYLRMYRGHYASEASRDDFEKEVAETLRSAQGIDEVLTSVRLEGLGALEIDLVVRRGNRVGIGEVKSKAKKDGIDHLNSAAAQTFLGTYVRKFLVSGTKVDPNNRELAAAYRIEVVELLSFGETRRLDRQDQDKLVKAVTRVLGARV